MNRASAEMLHCLNVPGIGARIEGMDMSVLEKQRIALNWQKQQQLQVQPPFYQQDNCSFNEASIPSLMPTQAQVFQGLAMGCDPNLIPLSPNLDELLNQPMKIDPGEDSRSIDFNEQSIQSVGQTSSLGYGLNHHGMISRTASCPPLVAAAQGKGRQPLTSEQKLTAPTGRESFKKRKAEKSLPPKGNAEEDNRSKKSNGYTEEEESKITELTSNRKSNSSQSNHKESCSNNNDKKNKEALPSTSKDNSKASEAQKPDYIHVRARRGQATDSHSLAERVRREKISERMKYLQDLVPGCNKITGKAGMLDEIINYVQSLQRQVEFLSMKLAAVNPKIDFSIEDLIAKQVFATCSTSMPTMGLPPDMTNTMCLQYNPIKQDPAYGSELPMNQLDIGLRRTISAPTSLPETFFDPSSFNQISSCIPWDANLQNMYAMECQQGRSVPSQLQTFTDNMEPSALQMGM